MQRATTPRGVVLSGMVVVILLFVTISHTAAQDCGILVGASGAVYNLTLLTRPASNPWTTSDIEDGDDYDFYWNFCTNLNGVPSQVSRLPQASPTIQFLSDGTGVAYSIGYLDGYQLTEIGHNEIQLTYTNAFEICWSIGQPRISIITVSCNISVPGDGVVLLVHEPSVCVYIINMQSRYACAYSECEPGFAPDPVSFECVACPAGYSTLGLSNQYKCTPCAAGSFSSEPGSANCTFCEAGTSTRGLTGEVNCSDCSAGTVSLEGYPVCSPCDPGYFTSVPRRSYCDPCSSGSSTNNNTGQASCALCPEGSFAPTPATAACYPCAAGYFAANTGQITCDPCPAGHFSDSGKAVCAACIAGTHNPNSGVAVCTPCEPGSFAANDGQLICDPCGVGSATNQIGQIACTPCTPGTAVNKTGSLDCDNCIAGYYTDTYGALACTPCSPGYSTENQTGQSVCAACGVGNFNPNMGASVCSKCYQGTYQSVTGQASCNSCPAGTFGETEGLVGCSICLPNTYSAVKSSGCTLCPARTHSIAGSKYCTLDEGPVAGIVVGAVVVVAGIGAAGWCIYKRRRGYTAV